MYWSCLRFFPHNQPQLISRPSAWWRRCIQIQGPRTCNAPVTMFKHKLDEVKFCKGGMKSIVPRLQATHCERSSSIAVTIFIKFHTKYEPDQRDCAWQFSGGRVCCGFDCWSFCPLYAFSCSKSWKSCHFCSSTTWVCTLETCFPGNGKLETLVKAVELAGLTYGSLYVIWSKEFSIPMTLDDDDRQPSSQL